MAAIKPTAEELANPDGLVVWSVEGNNGLVPVSSGRYDAATGTVSGTTTHLSIFAAAYLHKSFKDIDKAAWAKKQIEVLSAKGILCGRTEEEFVPGAEITRAEYISALVRALDLYAKEGVRFSDIASGSGSCRYIGIARALGITAGVGNNLFNPDAPITRQEMTVMTEKALRKMNLLSEVGSVDDLRKFSDFSRLSAYSVSSIAALVREGLVEGSGGSLNPDANITRAEAAVIIYKIYNRIR